MRCKHEWRQLIRMWSGSTNAKAQFYCIKCLKTTSYEDIDNYNFAEDMNSEVEVKE